MPTSDLIPRLLRRPACKEADLDFIVVVAEAVKVYTCKNCNATLLVPVPTI